MLSVRNWVIVLGAVGVALVLWMTSGEDPVAQRQGDGEPITWPRVESPVARSDAMEARIKDLLSRMSVAEKVGQIIQPEIQYIKPEEVKTYHIGSVLNGGGSLPNRDKYATPGEWLAMADAFYEASMDTSDGAVAIPILWGSDAVHGHNNVIGATIFPHNIGLGAMRDPALMRKIGEATAREMRVTGIDWTFAPTLAVVQNDRWGRTYESYSEDPAVVAAYAGPMVRGLQGEPGTEAFLDGDHVIATAKHFVGDGGTEGGDDQGDTRVSEKELRDIHAAGYFTALEAGVQSAMTSFSSWNGKKVHGDKYLVTDVLKDQMGFEGPVIGDWNAHGQVPGCTNADCPESVNAGVDILMTPQDWRDLYDNTLAQVTAGEIPMARLDDAVARILRMKLRAGLFDKPKPSERGLAGQAGVIGSAEHRVIARQAVRQSLVLIKNRENLLPIAPASRVLVVGDGAHNIGKQAGGWTISWQGTGNTNEDFPGGQSIFDGIRDAVAAAGGEAILDVDGTGTVDADVAIVVFGEDPYAEFQGDLASLEYEPGEKKALALINSLKERGLPVVSVFLSGRPLWANPEINASDAFVAAWLPGSEGGGVADVILAAADGTPEYDFTGTLSFSWPKAPLQELLNPHHDAYDPLFRLGYGLTYTSGEEGPSHLAEDVEGVQKGLPKQISLYAGRPLEPWRIYISDGGTRQIMSGSYAKLPTDNMVIRTADKDVQEDALAISWLAAHQGHFLVTGGGIMDLSTFAATDGILSFDLKADTVPAGEVSVAMSCGQSCGKSVRLTDHLRSLVGQDWQSVTIELACFASEEQLAGVDVPFRLESSDRAEISIANITVQPSGSAAISCDEGD